jgi:hypothetical protein
MDGEALLQRYSGEACPGRDPGRIHQNKTRQKTDWKTGAFAGVALSAAPPETVLPDSLAEFRRDAADRGVLSDL